MRTFYEEWLILDINSAVRTAELQSVYNKEDIETDIRQLELPRIKDFPIEEFFRIGFTHHIAILSQVKTVEERFFYIKIGC